MTDDASVVPSSETEPRRFFKGTQRKSGYKKPKAIPVAPGVRRVVNRLQAYVTAAGRTHVRLFPLDTDLATINAWRAYIKLAHGGARIPPYRRPLPPSTNGWCYLYFVRQGDAVKIGRANDVMRRVEELQTASALPLTLLVAVGAHASIEKEFLKRMEPYRLTGEWFIYGREIQAIVNRLQAGHNPVEMLFVWDQIVGPTDPTAETLIN